MNEAFTQPTAGGLPPDPSQPDGSPSTKLIVLIGLSVVFLIAAVGVLGWALGASGGDGQVLATDQDRGSTDTSQVETERRESNGDPSGNGDGTARQDGDASRNRGIRDAEKRAYVDEMTAAFEEDAGDESFPVDQIECWVGGMVDGIGVDKLKEAGFTPEGLGSDSDGADMEKLSEGDRTVVADSFTKCVDLKEIFISSIEAESGGEEMPKEMKECFDGIDWDAMERAFAEEIVSGDEEMESAAMAPLVGCMMMSLEDF